LESNSNGHERSTEADKRGRMKEIMDNYIEDLVSKGRLSEDRVYTPLLKEEDHE